MRTVDLTTGEDGTTVPGDRRPRLRDRSCGQRRRSGRCRLRRPDRQRHEPPRGDGLSCRYRAARSARASSCPTMSTGKSKSFNVAVNADGTQIAVAGGDRLGSTRIFDLRTGDSLTTIDPASGHAGIVPGPRDPSTSGMGAGRDRCTSARPERTCVSSIRGEFELLRDITVPAITTGGTLQFSDDGSFLVAGGGIQSEGGGGPQSAGRIDPANGSNLVDDRSRGVPCAERVTCSRSRHPMIGSGVPTSPA